MGTREHRWGHLWLLISILLLFAVIPFPVTLRHGPFQLWTASRLRSWVAGTYALSERKYPFVVAIVLSVIWRFASQKRNRRFPSAKHRRFPLQTAGNLNLLTANDLD
jgi:hypothetical protein